MKYLSVVCVSIFFLFLYLLLPTTNSSIDSWGFAAYVKQEKNLFLSHHLLYNALGFLWVKSLSLFGTFDTLHLLKVLNALFAALTLYVLGMVLKQKGLESKRNFIWVAFAGSTWVIMRFATENETYIIPLFFSLLGSYFFIKGNNDSQTKWFFISGLFSAIACLFHQVMFFWWLSILIGVVFRRKFKPIVWFALPALIVPVLYVLVLTYYYAQPLTIDALMHFVFRDYYSGAAGISVGLSSVAFLFISFIRSFFQVHGYIVNLSHYSYLFYVGGLLAIIFLLLAFIRFWQTQWNWVKTKESFVWVHLLAIILQLFFALLSSGNAEFMVMIPILLVIVLSQIIQNETKFIGLLASGMLVWNLSFGLIPLRFYELDNSNSLSARVLTTKNDEKQPLYILFNKPRVENEVKYYTGNYPNNIISGIQRDSLVVLKARIDNALAKGIPVFTDCINRPRTLSRENLVISTDYRNLFTDYMQVKEDSAQTLTGKYFLYLISKK